MMGEYRTLKRNMDPSGMGRLMIGASGLLAAGVNSRGALRSNDCRWIVSRFSARYLVGRAAVCRCCCDETLSVFTSRQSASEDCGLNEERTCPPAEALRAGGVAGQRLANANNTTGRKSSILTKEEWGIFLLHQKE